MSLAEVVSLIAGFALALSRLLTVAKPFWARVPKLAAVLPAVVAMLPALVAQLGLVTTELDLVETLVVAAAMLLPGTVPAPAPAPVEPAAPDQK